MKFLVHSSDCAYNTITKRWVCNLAQRFSNPTQFTLVAGSYRCSTADSYPIAVYLRSEALQKLCKTHHSIELAPHEIISDAFGILRMSDSSDVFHLESRFHFPVHSHLTEQKLDFYFTDNRTLLNGIYTPPLVQGVTDTMMEAHATADDIVVWIDMAKAGAVLDFSNNQSVVDGVVGKIISRVPGGVSPIECGRRFCPECGQIRGDRRMSRDCPGGGHKRLRGRELCAKPGPGRRSPLSLVPEFE